MTYVEQFPDVELPPKPESALGTGTFEYNLAVVAKRKHAMAVLVDAMGATIDTASPGDTLAWMTARAVLDGLISMKQRGLLDAFMGGA